MKFTRAMQLAMVGVSGLVGLVGLSPNAQGQPQVSPPLPPATIPPQLPPTSGALKTIVACAGKQTVISRGTKRATLISWQTNEFGAQFTPEKRCQIVSQKLQTAVNGAGGKLSNLNLTNGPVNNRQVICVVPTGSFTCTSTNMLFTLKRANERNAKAIIQNMTNFKSGSSAIVEDSGEQGFMNLGEFFDAKGVDTSAADSAPSSPPNPAPAVPAVDDSF